MQYTSSAQCNRLVILSVVSQQCKVQHESSAKSQPMAHDNSSAAMDAACAYALDLNSSQWHCQGLMWQLDITSSGRHTQVDQSLRLVVLSTVTHL
jgi:hypothetical protein